MHNDRGFGKTILNFVPCGLLGVESRRILFANDAVETLFGWKPEELVGQSTRVIFRNDREWEEFGEILYSSLKNHSIFIFEPEIPFIKKDGQAIFCRNSVTRVGKETTQAGKIVITFEDINERKASELELIETKQRMEDIINFLPDATFVIDLNGRIISWNKAAEEITGIKARDMIGKGNYEYAIPFYGQRRPIIVDLVLKHDRELEGTYSNIQRKMKTLSGENFCPAVGKTGAYMRATASPLFDSHGKIVGAIESVRDATEQKKAEEELVQIKKAVESASNAIWLTDNKAKYVIYHNEAFTRLFKYRKDDINKIGGTPALYTDRDLAKKIFNNLIGNSWAGEIPLRTSAGAEIPVYLFADAVKDDNGKNIAYVGIANDIAEQKQAESALLESRQRLADIIEFLPDATLVIDQEGKVIAWNKALEEMTGVKAEKVLNKGDYEYAIPFYGDRRPILIDLVLKSDSEFENEYSIIYREKESLIADTIIDNFKGREANLWGKANILYDTQGRIAGAIETIRDITDRKKSENIIRETQQRLADIINFMPDASFVIDLKGHVISWNKAAEEMTGIKAEEIIGKGDYEYSISFYGVRKPILIDLVLKSSEEFEKEYPHIERKGCILIGENFCPAVKGTGAYLRATASPLYDSHGNIVGAIESIRDATESKKAEEQMKYLSLHDALTGLYNRTYFDEEMNRLQIGRYSAIGLVECDIDGLKLVNDTFGHEAGDRLLITAARIIKGCFRGGDMVARVGGDEFTIVLPNIEPLELEQAILRLRAQIEEYNDQNPELPLSISIGYEVTQDERCDIKEMYKRVDNNMYREKLRRKQSARSSIVKTLMKALETRDFITSGHANRMQDLAADLAKEAGLAKQNINDLFLLTQFHDIGKVGIPDRILFKPGPLNTEEMIEMQRHCEMGYQIAIAAPELSSIAEGILKHQEWWNGQGYPLGLKGEEIPLECRILSIADAYDAMTNDRPYRKAMSGEAAVEELERCAGTQFDPDLVRKFIYMIKRKERTAI